MEESPGGGASFSAGTRSKGDCLVSWRPGKDGLRLCLESSVAPLFGRLIRETAAAEAHRLGAGGELSIFDDGALDYVVAARVEAALRAGGLQAPLHGVPSGPRSCPQLSPEVLADRKSRPRRSRLYIPGNQPELAINSGLFRADCILLDLEDSVALDRKTEARIHLRRLLACHRSFLRDSEIAVRVNPLASPAGLADLAELVPVRPEVLVLPKCESAEDVRAWDREVGRLEAQAGLPEGGILFMPLVETAVGLSRATQIAAASPRNVALCFGAEDYRRDLGVEAGPAEEETAVARGLVVLAARAAGIEAQDSVFSRIEDEAGLEASARRARALGFQGKGILHPGQIETAHRVFSPSPAEIAGARRVVEALARAEAEGRGVASLDGLMIDAPVAARARRVLAMAGSLGRNKA